MAPISRRRELAVPRRYGSQYAGVPAPTFRTLRELERIDQETLQIQGGLLGNHAVKQLERQLDHQLTDAELRDIKEEYRTGTQYAQEVPAAEAALRDALTVAQARRIVRMQS